MIHEAVNNVPSFCVNCFDVLLYSSILCTWWCELEVIKPQTSRNGNVIKIAAVSGGPGSEPFF